MDDRNIVQVFLSDLDVDAVSKETEFKIADVNFEMTKMNAWDGIELLEVLREKWFSKLFLGNIQGFATISASFLKRYVITPMTENTVFKTPEMTKGTLLLKGNEGTAFDPQFGMEPTDIYQLMGRFLAINFPNLLHLGIKSVGSP